MNRVSSLKKKLLSLLVAGALVVVAVTPALAAAPCPGYHLSIAPLAQDVTVGASFTVKVMQDTPGGSNSAESDFEFNHGLVKITGVARGKPYADKGATLMPGKMGEAIAEANLDGSLNTVAAICGFGVFVDKGPQEFLVITMKALAVGTSDLTLTKTSIFDTAYATRRPTVTNGKVTVAVAPPPPPVLPDLIVSEKSEEWVVKGKTYNVTFTIKNQGAGPAAASTAAILVDGTEVDTEAIGALAAGARETKTVGTFTFTAPKDTIKVVADSGKAVTETNEANNTKENVWRHEVFCLKLPADLIVTECSVFPLWVGVDDGAGTFNVTFTIENIGKEAAGPSQASVEIFDYDDKKVRIEPARVRAVVSISALAADASTGPITVGPFTFAAPKNTIRVTANSGKAITESDEDNNTIFASLEGDELKADGKTRVTGFLEPAFISLTVPSVVKIDLVRGMTNSAIHPVTVNSAAAWGWQLSVEDPKDLHRGHMTAGDATRLSALSTPMKVAYGGVTVNLADGRGASLLTRGTGQKTVNAKLQQFVTNADPAGDFTIEVTFTVIPVF